MYNRNTQNTQSQYKIHNHNTQNTQSQHTKYTITIHKIHNHNTKYTMTIHKIHNHNTENTQSQYTNYTIGFLSFKKYLPEILTKAWKCSSLWIFWSDNFYPSDGNIRAIIFRNYRSMLVGYIRSIIINYRIGFWG